MSTANPRHDTRELTSTSGLCGRTLGVAKSSSGAEEVRFIHPGAVDLAGDAILQAVEHLGLLGCREPACRHCVVELALRIRKQRVDQTVDRLAVRCRNLREALTALELGAKLGLGYPDVAGRGLEASEPEMAEAAMKSADKRKVA